MNEHSFNWLSADSRVGSASIHNHVVMAILVGALLVVTTFDRAPAAGARDKARKIWAWFLTPR